MTISFSGLASGFKSDEYIEAIMAQAKVPYNKLNTKKSTITAYQNVFKNINTKLATLKEASTALKDASTFKTTTATPSDTTKLTATSGDNAITGSYSVKVESLAQQQVVATKAFTSATVTDASLPDSITINEKSIDLSDLQGKTMDEVLSAVSSRINALGEKVSASIVQTAAGEKTLTLTATEAGEANEISFVDDAGFFGFTEKQKASDAKLTVNGIEVTSTTNAVKDAIPGVVLELTDTGNSTVKVSSDTSAITAKVEAFVKAYNDIITTITNNTQKSTENSDGTLSLTLQSDPLLRDLKSQMNQMLNTLVSDTSGFRMLSEIGLEIDKGITSASLMTGTITFDKEKFAEKITENPAGIQKMFASSTASGDAYDGLGIIFENRMKVWNNSVDGLITSKVKGYDSEIGFITEQMESMSSRLDLKEQSLKKQYARLEVVISQMNSQKDYLTSQLSSLTNSSSSS